jgi:hypothetical protein
MSADEWAALERVAKRDGIGVEELLRRVIAERLADEGEYDARLPSCRAGSGSRLCPAAGDVPNRSGQKIVRTSGRGYARRRAMWKPKNL